MNHYSGLRGKSRVAACLVLAVLFSGHAGAADIPASGNLTLQEAVRIAVKNAPSMILEAIKVDLAKADEKEAGDPFDASFKASGAYNAVRGYVYPSELQQIGQLAVPPVSAFVTDNRNESEFKSDLSKLFRNGVYADFSITLQSSDSDKLRTDFADGSVIAGLNAYNLKPGAQIGDYFPAHPSIVQLLVNVPLLKFSGDHNIAAANEQMKRYQREAAELTLKQGVASIIQNVVNRYWDYKAALVKLQYTEESEARAKRWLAKLQQSIAAVRRDHQMKVDPTEEVSHLQGFTTQLGGDVSKAREVVNVARNTLAQALGLPSSEARRIVQAQDDFPLDWSAVQASFDDDAMRRKWDALADQKRFDLKAAKLQFEAANEFYLGARNDEKPKLDLSFILQQQGLSAGGSNGVDLSSLTTGRGGLGHTVMLSYEKKFGNDKAEAQLIRAHDLKLQTETQLNSAKRDVGLAVDSAVGSVHNSLVGLAAAKRQTAYYMKALGALTRNDTVALNQVFDLVVLEQARLKAFTDHISAVQSVAEAVTAARFQTGTLVKQGGQFQQVVVSDLTKLP